MSERMIKAGAGYLPSAEAILARFTLWKPFVLCTLAATAWTRSEEHMPLNEIFFGSREPAAKSSRSSLHIKGTVAPWRKLVSQPTSPTGTEREAGVASHRSLRK